MQKISLLYLLLVICFSDIHAAIKDTFICAGQSIAFDAGQAGTAYQWQVQRQDVNDFSDLDSSVTYNGTRVRTMQIKDVPSYVSGTMFRCAITVNSSTQYSDTFHIRIKATWLGTIDSNWQNKSNWECGVVPDRYTEVHVSSASHTGGNDLNVYTQAEVKSIKVLPGTNVSVGLPGSVVIWGNTFWPAPSNPVQHMVGEQSPGTGQRIWRGYTGEIGDVQLDGVNMYEAAPPCGETGQGYEFLIVDSLHMVFYPDFTGYLRFYNHGWFAGSCDTEPYDEHYVQNKNFVWSEAGSPRQVLITFDGGLASENEGPLLFDIMEAPGVLLHLSAELLPEPDDLYFNVIFN